ncbi:unnamed protein product [Penicillium salamii]|nr:unnamed protein product [Penicillium salamii]
MEAIGLGIGIVGLAGLFSTCLDVVNRFDSFKEFDTVSHLVKTQFKAQKLRLQKWGHIVGLQGDRLMEKHSELLDDERIRSVCSELLSAIEAICSYDDDTKSPLSIVLDHRQSLRDKIWSRKGRTGQESKLEKLSWALGDKAKKMAQVGQFCLLVDTLHNLVPIDGRGDAVQSRSGEVDQDIMTNGIKRDLHTWLLGPDSPKLFEISAGKRIPGTCEWALRQSWFLDWSSSEFPGDRAKVLWINGPAGFGKSILCARITEHLLEDLKSPVGHFDFESRRNPFVAMRSWISQLMSHSTVFALTRERASANQGRKPTREDIKRLLRDIVTAIPGCTFIIDGLDECSSAGDDHKLDGGNSIPNFLERLKSIVSGTETRILIVSRDEPEIRNSLCNDEDQAYVIYHHNIRADDVRSDTEIYSRSVVNQKLSNRTEEIKEEIALRLAGRCDGQFLWVKLQEDCLRRGKSKMQIERDINSTPRGLEHAYERNWQRISLLDDKDRDRTVSLLRWAAFALRPLTVNEITGALLINDECYQVRVDELPDSIDEDYIATEILDLCGSLVEIRIPQGECDVGLRTVQLTHFSVKQYLLSIFPSQRTDLQLDSDLRLSTEVIESTLLAKMCISYLDCEEVWFEKPHEPGEGNFLSAFRGYATRGWLGHAQLGNMQDKQLMDLVKHLFDTANPNWILWKNQFDSQLKDAVDIMNQDNSQDNMTCTDSDPDILEYNEIGPFQKPADSSTEDSRALENITDCPLWYAALLNLTFMMDTMIAANKDRIDEQGVLGFTALELACGTGCLRTVQMLLDNDANLGISPVSGRQSISLKIASFQGHYEIVKLLLTKHIDIEGTNKDAMTPLCCAVSKGHVDIARLLLDHGADVEARGADDFTPIHTAVEEGHIELVKMLIGRSANIMTTSDEGIMPFYTACLNGFIDIVRLLFDLASNCGHLEIVHFLLEKGANIEARDNQMMTPLHWAALNGHTKTTQLLLDHGAQVEVQNINGYTPVHAAVSKGHVELVKLLIAKGVNVATANNWGMGPFYAACLSGLDEIAQVLVDFGVDTNLPTQEIQWTPLNVASSYGHVGIVKFLLENAADIDIPTKDQQTSLDLAAMGGHPEVVKILLGKGADINTSDVWGRSPLNTAAWYGHLEIVKMLLDGGAEIESKNHLGMTPLYSASMSGFTEIVKVFIEKGADYTAAETHGWTPMSVACSMGHADIVKLFLDQDPPPSLTEQDSAGQTALMFATIANRLDVVTVLLERGAEITLDTPTNQQLTPIYYASRNESTEILKLFLQKGANVNFQDYNGWNAISAACANGYLEAVKLLVRYGADLNIVADEGLSPLYLASSRGFTEIVRLLLEAGADINKHDKAKYSALDVAILADHFEIVRMLLEKDPDAHFAGRKTWTPLHTAASSNSVKSIYLAFEYADPDLEALSQSGRTPLFIAVTRGHTDAVKILHSRGASVNRPDEYGATPLWVAVKNGHREVVEYLLSLPGTLQTPQYDAWNRSLLWWALGCGSDEIVELVRGIIDAPESTGMDTVEKCSVVKFNSSLRRCNVCTRCILQSETYQSCGKCSGLFYFHVCLQCVGFKVHCGDRSHVWEKIYSVTAPEKTNYEDRKV